MFLALRSLTVLKWCFLAIMMVTLTACLPSSPDPTDSPDNPFDTPAESLPSE